MKKSKNVIHIAAYFVLVVTVSLVGVAAFVGSVFIGRDENRFSSGGARTLVSAVLSRNPSVMFQRPFGAADRRRLLDIIDVSPSLEGQDDLQIVSLAELVALNDRPAATHLKKSLKKDPNVPLG